MTHAGGNKVAVGRFAPTPSGRMHLGNVLCAVLAYLSVKKKGGRFLIRIEDLDAARCPKSAAQQIISDLRTLGIVADEEILWQSNRFGEYAKWERVLDGMSLTYPCFCSRAELHAAAAPHLSDGSYVYDGRCLRLSTKEIESKSKLRPACKRVKAPDCTVSFTDGLTGECSQNLARECGDFIIKRSDGIYAYQLAVAIDDAVSGVTEVLRGGDLLSSTARQIWLLKLFGFEPPQYIHIPLLCDFDGRRLSKRDGDSLDFALKNNTPQRILGALAFSCGLLHKFQSVTLSELIAVFDLNKLHKDFFRLPVGFLN